MQKSAGKENERLVRDAANRAIEVIVGFKKSGFWPVLPANNETGLARTTSLLKILAFQDNNGDLPEGVSEEFMREISQEVLSCLYSANLMLPERLRRHGEYKMQENTSKPVWSVVRSIALAVFAYDVVAMTMITLFLLLFAGVFGFVIFESLKVRG